MKNLLFVLIGIFVFISCSKSNKEVIPDDIVIEPTEEDKYWGFHVQDTVNLKLYGMGAAYILSDTCIALCGVKNGKLWIGVYDTDTRNEKFTWISKNDYSLTQAKNMGYGKEVVVNIDRMHMSYVNFKNEKNFRLLFFSYEKMPSIQNIWNLLFVHDGQEMFYRDAKYYEAQSWYNDCVLAINEDADPDVYTVFDAIGNKKYDLSPSFFLNWDSYSFLNAGEVISFKDDINSNGKYKIARIDVKTNTIAWVHYIFSGQESIFDDKIPTNSKVGYIIDEFKDDYMVINMNVLNYDGTQITRVFKININTGKFETVGYGIREVLLNKNSLEIGPGEMSKLIATILPTNATNSNVEWSVDKSNIVKIDKIDNHECSIIGVAEGSATVTCTTKDGNKVATCQVTVKPILVQDIIFDENLTNTCKGEVFNLNAKVIPVNATNPKIKWSCDRSDLIEIDEQGNIKVVGDDGVVVITAKSEDGNAEQIVYLYIKPVNELISVDACIYQLSISSLEGNKVILNSCICNPTSVQVEVLNVMLIENSNVKEIFTGLGVIGKEDKVSTVYKELFFPGLQYMEIISILSNYLVRYQVRIDGQVFNIEKYIDASRAQIL